jgi:soluble lytic murein transglycosylase
MVALLTVHGCGPAASDPQGPVVPSSLPPWLAQPLPAHSGQQPAGPVEALPATVANPNRPTFDPATIVPWLADPRLVAVNQQVSRQAYKGAADGLTALLRNQPPAATEEPAWQYQLGRLRKLAGDPAAAIIAFDRAAADEWVLSDYARYLAAELLVKAGQPAEALARLNGIAAGTAIDQAVALTKARALVASRQVDAAAPIFRAFLAKRPRPSEWQLVALELGRALLNEPSHAHAEETVTVARQVIFQSPNGRGVGEARQLETQALATIPSHQRGPLVTPKTAELVARARGLAEARQGREAMAAAAKIIEGLKNDKGVEDESANEVSCEAYMARAKGLAALRRYSEASEAMGTAIERCQGQPRQVFALFLGGRYALRGGRIALARKRYMRLEQSFPTHRFADDARLHGAEAALKLGDVAAFTKLLSRIDEAYPQGDMVDQALFALALARIDNSDWAGAVQPLTRAIRRQVRGRPYWAQGRPQYFLARAKLQLGAQAEGIALLSQVIRDFPLSYYMVQAHARLASHDPVLASKVLAEALAVEPHGSFVIADHPELHRPAFLRAVELVRQGDGPRALTELETLGVRDKSAHPSLLWAAAFLLARIDAPAESHGVLRSSTGLWREHYPIGVWRPVWEIAHPRPHHEIVKKELGRSAIPEHLAYAIMREESAFQPRVISSSNAYGLMQLILPTAQRMARRLGLPASAEALKRPAVNIALGCRYLSILQRKFDYNPVLAIPGYNAGPGAPVRWVDAHPADDFDLWVERIPYRETRRYTKRVLRAMAAYAMLYGKGMAGDLMQLPLQVRPTTVLPSEALDEADGSG